MTMSASPGRRKRWTFTSTTPVLVEESPHATLRHHRRQRGAMVCSAWVLRCRGKCSIGRFDRSLTRDGSCSRGYVSVG